MLNITHNTSWHHGRLRFLAALFSLVVLLVGMGAGAPSDPTPPPDAPTPAQLRAKDWIDKPDTLLPEERNVYARQAVEQDTIICNGRYEWFENRTLVMAYTSFRPEIGNWDVFARIPCDNESVVNISQSPWVDYGPNLNHEATSIVYTSDRAGNDEIYTTSRSGGITHRLTNNPATDSMAAYSPDGSQIIFVSDRTGYPEIYRMTTDGGQLVRLTNFHSNNLIPLYPDWSPDGIQIAFSLSDGEYGRIVIMNSDGSHAHFITPDLHLLGRLRWSPNGTRFAFDYDEDNDYWISLGTVNADGSSLQTVVWNPDDMPVDYQVGGWSPDGNLLVYTFLEYRYSMEYHRWLLYDTQQMVTFMAYFSAATPYDMGGYSLDIDLRSTDSLAPVSGVDPLPEYFPANTPLTITWWAKDYGTSGLKESWILYKRPPPYAYDDILKYVSDINASEGHFEATASFSPGEKFYFTSVARDAAVNTEPLHEPWEEIVSFYKWKASGQVVDSREQPLGNVQIGLNPESMNTPVTGPGGSADIYFQNGNDYQVTFTRAGFGVLPAQNWNINANRDFLAVLPETDEQVTNGQFSEEIPLSGWQVDGPMAAIEGAGHEGGKAVEITGPCGEALCLTDPQVLGAAPAGEMVKDSLNTLHVVSRSGEYYSKPTGGTWQSGPALPPGTYANLVVGPQDELMVVQSAPGMQIFLKPAGISWSTKALPVLVNYPPAVDFGPNGRIHLVYTSIASGVNAHLYYVSALPDGEWSAPLLLDTQPVVEDAQAALKALGDGTVFVTYRKPYNRPGFVEVLPNGTTGQAGTLTLLGGWNWMFQYIDHPQILEKSDNSLYVLARIIRQGMLDGITPLETQELVYWVRLENGTWDWPRVIPGNSHTGSFTDLSEFAGWGGAGFDANGALHVSYLDILHSENNLAYHILSDNLTTCETKTVTLAGNPTSLNYIPDSNIGGHLLVGGSGGLAYQAVNIPVQAQLETISQTISLPETMRSPTLSFFYRMDAFLTSTAIVDLVLLEQGQQPVILFTKQQSVDWTHVWADMTPWLGKQVTLEFRLHQPMGEYPPQVFIDEISVTSWIRSKLLSVTPQETGIISEEGVWIRLHGEDLMPGSKVYLDKQEIGLSEYDEATGDLLVWLSQDMLPGLHDVTVAAPSGIEETLTDALHVGMELSIPLLTK